MGSWGRTFITTARRAQGAKAVWGNSRVVAPAAGAIAIERMEGCAERAAVARYLSSNVIVASPEYLW